ncbi:MAG: M23 family peptidase, partial [Dermatophilaceae bacterium]|nr:M23 family peptidase [Dermatophilaceae bacterium]
MRRDSLRRPATALTAAGLVVACTVSVGAGIAARADSVSDQKKRNDKRIAALGEQLEG